MSASNFPVPPYPNHNFSIQVKKTSRRLAATLLLLVLLFAVGQHRSDAGVRNLTVLFERYPYEGIGPAYIPPVLEYDYGKLSSAQAAKLQTLVNESGLLLPGAREEYGRGVDGGQGPASSRPHGGFGNYSIRVYRAGTVEPAANVSWTGENAPERVWPLIEFLSNTDATGAHYDRDEWKTDEQLRRVLSQSLHLDARSVRDGKNRALSITCKAVPNPQPPPRVSPGSIGRKCHQYFTFGDIKVAYSSGVPELDALAKASMIRGQEHFNCWPREPVENRYFEVVFSTNGHGHGTVLVRQ